MQAASEYYMNAFNDLPRNPEVALGGFKKVARPVRPGVSRGPERFVPGAGRALGVARSLEARNDLPKAIEKYDLIATNWPGTPEAEQAKQLAEALRDPAAASFYKQLYAYSPPKVTLPPQSTQELQFPATGITLPAEKTTLPAKPTPLIDMPLELAPPTAAERKKLEESKSPAGAAAPKADATKKATDKPALPVDVLAPDNKAAKKK